eukprot:6126751-Prymnesium_polylepis.1
MEFLQSTISPSPCLPFAPSWRPSRRRTKVSAIKKAKTASDSVQQLLASLSKPAKRLQCANPQRRRQRMGPRISSRRETDRGFAGHRSKQQTQGEDSGVGS